MSSVSWSHQISHPYVHSIQEFARCTVLSFTQYACKVENVQRTKYVAIVDLKMYCCLQYDKAMEFYSKAVKIQPSHAEAHCNMGVICKNRGQTELAVKHYRDALKFSPNFKIVRANIALALTELATGLKNLNQLEQSMTYSLPFSSLIIYTVRKHQVYLCV